MGKQPTDVIEASRQTAALPAAKQVQLPGGRCFDVKRLNWLQFELLWAEMSSIIAVLLTDETLSSTGNLAGELAGAPQFVLKLVQQSAGISEQELSAWAYDDVLAVAAAAIELNFTESAGLRSFFLAASDLLGQAGPEGAAAARQLPTT